MIISKKEIRRTLQTSRKHKVIVTEAESYSINASELQWSDGTRHSFQMINAATGNQVAFEMPRLADWKGQDGPLNAEIEIPPGSVLIVAGTFCGKPATPHIYGRMADIMPR